MFLAEGVRLLEEALRWKVRPASLYYHRGVSSRGQKLISAFGKQAVTANELTESQLSQITSTDHSQGIAGLFDLPEDSLTALYRSDFRRILWCHGLADPGNIGTLLRSALAFEFDMLVMSGNCADPFSPKLVRSSMGAVFALPVASAKQDEVAKLVREEKFFVIAADSEGGQGAFPAPEEKPSPKIMLAIGSEATGLPKEIIDTANLVLRIKHADAVDSLNAAVAGSILMREIYERY